LIAGRRPSTEASSFEPAIVYQLGARMRRLNQCGGKAGDRC
jgi:hypothetical protein